MQLNELLEDVPQATLYRHVNAMFEEQLLKIVKTKNYVLVKKTIMQ